jgi:hypothetical protein
MPNTRTTGSIFRCEDMAAPKILGWSVLDVLVSQGKTKKAPQMGWDAFLQSLHSYV